MDELLSQFILDKNFPCIMAKSVIKTGLVKVVRVKNAPDDITDVLAKLYTFIDE